MLPYTGTYAKLGKFIDDGFRLYVEQKGGKLGGREIAFVQVDDESKPEAATDNMNRLVGREKALLGVRRRMLSLVRGDGGTLLVSGSPGTGRSRLLDACVLEGKLLGATVLRADASDAAAGDWGVARTLTNQLVERQPGEAFEAARGIRMAAGQQAVAERAEREQIRARVERLHLQRLRRHERRRPDDILGDAHAGHRAEIEQLRASVLGTAYVAARHVAVQQPARVQDRERGRHVAQQRARLAPWQPPPLVEVRAAEQLHRVVGAELVDAVVVDLDDPRMRELRQRVVLALEQRLALLGLAAVAREAALQRESLAVTRVADEIDRAHPAAP